MKYIPNHEFTVKCKNMSLSAKKYFTWGKKYRIKTITFPVGGLEYKYTFQNNKEEPFEVNFPLPRDADALIDYLVG